MPKTLKFTLPFLAKAAGGASWEDAPDGGVIIRGVATGELIDLKGERLKWAGIKKAFAGWQGNVINEHTDQKTGQLVKETVGTRLQADFDEEKKTVTVTAFVSNAARDVCTKIREGVLKAFSVEGYYVPGGTQMVKEAGKRITDVTEWGMTALAICGSAAIGALGHFEVLRKDAEAGYFLFKDGSVLPEPEEIGADYREHLRLKKDEDVDLYGATSVIGCGQNFIREISFLRASEAAEDPPEAEQVTLLDSAMTDVQSAVTKLKTFLGLEAAELAESDTDYSLGSMIVQTHRAIVGMKKLSKQMPTAPAPGAFTAKDSERLAKDLGDMVNDLQASLSKDMHGIATVMTERFGSVEARLKKFGDRVVPSGLSSKDPKLIEAVNKDATAPPAYDGTFKGLLLRIYNETPPGTDLRSHLRDNYSIGL